MPAKWPSGSFPAPNLVASKVFLAFMSQFLGQKKAI
jgi:hypothetical protein